MILIVVGIIIALYSFVNYKKAFIYFLGYQIFVQFGIQLYSNKSVSIPLGLVVSGIFFLQFLHGRKYEEKRMKEFPFKKAFFLILISRFLTCFVALGSFTEELNRAITFSFQSIINIYIGWYVFDSEDRYKDLFKITTIIIFIACILGYIEYFIEYNPYTNYEKNFIGEGINYYDPKSVRGFRITSVFEHPIGAGMNFGLYFVVTMYLLINEWKKVPMKRLAIITSFLCIPLVFMTKQRSAMLFTLMISTILFDHRKKGSYIVAYILFLLVVIFSPIISKYSQYFTSIFDENAQAKIRGSTLEMRMTQLNSCVELLKISPLFGIGEKYTNYLNNNYTKDALMLESVWLEQMVKHGILGMLAYFILFYEQVIGVARKYKTGKLIIINIAFWITYTITTVPSFRMYYLYILIFYTIFKSSDMDYSREEKK